MICSIKAEILLYSALFGLFKALWLGYKNIVPSLVGTIHNIKDHQKVDISIELSVLDAIEVTYCDLYWKHGDDILQKMELPIDQPEHKEFYNVMIKAVQEYFKTSKPLF